MKVSNKKKNVRVKMMAGLKKQPTCPNCGEKGQHYVPPSIGEKGFYVCQSND